MPIRPENRARYPKDWRQISNRIRFERAASRCECEGRCGRGCVKSTSGGRCEARHGNVAPISGSKVILTVAHLDHTPENCIDSNLMAMCQGCHLAYDAEHHAETARASRAAALADQMDPLFEVGA
jgi:hypothetical protein